MTRATVGVEPVSWTGLGCMRLSTEPLRDEAAAVVLLHAAFDAGIDFLDTARAYCLDEAEAGHNERLIARALASWSGDRARIRVATKGGLTRPGGRWVPDARARSLIAACEASRRALGVERIFLYQLHAPDPRVPLATSVRALEALRRDGLVERIGLSNVSLRQLEEALRHAEIDSVQVELGVLRDDCLWNGVAARCIAEGIPLLAYRPLGGPGKSHRIARDPALAAVAERRGATPHEVALAWLGDLSPWLVPLPGATRLESVASQARARQLRLDDEDRRRLDERFPAGRILRQGPPRRPVAPAAEGEVVLIMGLPGAGKSTLAQALVSAGYDRLNRDEAGGRLASLLPALDRLLASGRRRVVLDNTYVTRKSRAAVVAKAAEHGLAARCIWLEVRIGDAQVNATQRMLARHGRLLEPEEMRAAAKSDPGAFGPDVLFRYARDLEPPDPSEGFSHIEVLPFARKPAAGLTNRALVVWLDGIVWRSRSGRRTPDSPKDVDVLPGRAEILQRHGAEGLLVLGLTWQPEIEAGQRSRETLQACIAELSEQVGLQLDVLHCPHGGGPPVCWCRKPLPGLGVQLIVRHRLEAARCLCVGSSSLDRTFAERLGFGYRDHAGFFVPADEGPA